MRGGVTAVLLLIGALAVGSGAPAAEFKIRGRDGKLHTLVLPDSIINRTKSSTPTVRLDESRLAPGQKAVTSRAATRAVPGPYADANAVYSNIDNQLAFYTAYNICETVGTNSLTRVVADDLTFSVGASVSTEISTIRFGVFNPTASGATITALPYIHVWAADGAGGTPGTYLFGGALSSDSWDSGFWYTYTLGPLAPGSGIPIPTIPGSNTIWMGMQFDNEDGVDSACSLLQQLGVILYDPPVVGSSQNLRWRSDSPLSILTGVNSPTGSTSTSTGTVLSMYYELVVNVLPVELMNFTAD